MGRPPCCDKVGVKKGPWTPEEDIVLVSYIQEHGPGNWRSIPTNAGNSNNLLLLSSYFPIYFLSLNSHLAYWRIILLLQGGVFNILPTCSTALLNEGYSSTGVPNLPFCTR